MFGPITKILVANFIFIFSFPSFADSCRTFVVKGLVVNDEAMAISSKNGPIYGQHATDPKWDKVSWRISDASAQGWYNLAVLSMTLDKPITVCQKSGLKNPEAGPYPYASKISYMYFGTLE